jgi:hypothetical protein
MVEPPLTNLRRAGKPLPIRFIAREALGDEERPEKIERVGCYTEPQ